MSSSEVTNITLQLLRTITDDFSEQKKIGSGSYGEVYKGVLNGEEVAVKKFYVHGLEDAASENELNNLMKVKHKNVIRLIGYCYETAHKHTEHNGKPFFAQVIHRALCFEYMQGGSLHKHISDKSCIHDWSTTYKIIKGTCEGIHYLHKGRGEKNCIYHLDLKPANILLDENMVPKIGDFGLSRLFGESKIHETCTRKGTIGFMPPEFIDNRIITPKYDVFSLGVIIFHIMAGKNGYNDYCDSRSSQQFLEKHRPKFLASVQEYWKKKMQATAGYEWNETDLLGVKKCTEIAMSCVEIDRNKRPTTEMIIDHLNKLDAQIEKILRKDPVSLIAQNQVEDRISGLPDHILLHILDRLDLPVVIQASTLSRRWAHLPCLLTRLLIDVSHFLPRDKNKRANCTVDQIMTTYTGVVIKLLQSSSDNRAIEHLQLSFYLADPHLRRIGHVVGNVMERGNTKRLEFTIWADVPHPSYERCVLLGQRFMSFLHACPSAFRGLTSLILQNLTFGDSDIPNVLNFCTKLELLSLTNCDSVIDPVTGDDVALLIDAPQSSVVALEISTCGYAAVELIQMPKLQRLVCANWIGTNPPLRFGIVPCLNSITLRCAALNWQRPFTLSNCLSNITRLSIIYLNFADQMIWIEPEDPKHLSPVFDHLRDVYLYNIFYECDLNWTMFVLEAAPSLSNFYLKLSRHPCERSRCEDSAKKVDVLWDQTPHDFKHHCLNQLEIVGFVVDEKLAKYIRLVIQLAMGLKKIRLLDQEPCARCDALNDAQTTSSTRWRFPVEEEEKKVIREQLVDGFSSPVEISIG